LNLKILSHWQAFSGLRVSSATMMAAAVAPGKHSSSRVGPRAGGGRRRSGTRARSLDWGPGPGPPSRRRRLGPGPEPPRAGGSGPDHTGKPDERKGERERLAGGLRDYEAMRLKE
jgi:hypothetical protein